MPTNDNNITVDLLSERIEAQIIAHEKYSQAFVRILDVLAEIKTKINGLDIVDSDDLDNINEKVEKISQLFIEHHLVSKQSKETIEEGVKRTNELVQQALKQIDLQYSNADTKLKDLVTKHLEDHAVQNKKLLETLVSQNNQIGAFSTNLKTNTDALIDIDEKLAKLKDIQDKLGAFVEHRNVFFKHWDKVKIYILAIGTIFVVIQALIQMGVFKIHWLTN